MSREVINVFLSSTGRDLWDFRQVAISTINGLDGYRCINMESFGARDSPPEDFCRAAVKNANLLVGIIAHMHGACPPGSERSYTEIEYDEAKGQRIPRMMFVAPWDFPITANIIEPDEKRARQVAFRDRVELERIRATFRTPDELGKAIAQAIFNWEHSQLRTEKSGEIDFTRLFEAHTGFVGRAWLREALDKFIAGRTGGYFIVEGKPGIGKTSFAVDLVRTRDYVHHFNSLNFGIVKTERFLRSLCAQIHRRYEPKHPKPTEKEFEDSQYITDLLFAAAKTTAEAPIVIVVDALDEAEDTPVLGTNPLALPGVLPSNIVFLLTRRDTANFLLSSENPKDVHAVDGKSRENLADVHEYTKLAATRPGLEPFRRDAGLDHDGLVRLLLEKSEGNFMYLIRVVPSIEAGEYDLSESSSLPQGLQDYYARHWQKMRHRNLEQWMRLFLPIIGALAVVREPISALEIRAFVSRRVGDPINRYEISTALHEIQEFIETTTMEGERCYSLYHSSFREFLEKTAEVQEFLS